MYSRPWKELTVGGEVFAGRDVFGQTFWRLSGFVRYGGDAKHAGRRRRGRSTDSAERTPPPAANGQRRRGVRRCRRKREQGAHRSASQDFRRRRGSGHRSAFRTGRTARRHRQGTIWVCASEFDEVDVARAARRAADRLSAPLRRIVRAQPVRRRRPLQSRDARLFDLCGRRRGMAQFLACCPNGIWRWTCATGRTSPGTTCCPRDLQGAGRTASTRSKASSRTFPAGSETRPCRRPAARAPRTALAPEPVSLARAARLGLYCRLCRSEFTLRSAHRESIR